MLRVQSSTASPQAAQPFSIAVGETEGMAKVRLGRIGWGGPKARLARTAAATAIEASALKPGTGSQLAFGGAGAGALAFSSPGRM